MHFLEQFMVEVEAGIAGVVARAPGSSTTCASRSRRGNTPLVVLCWLGGVDDGDKVRMAWGRLSSRLIVKSSKGRERASDPPPRGHFQGADERPRWGRGVTAGAAVDTFPRRDPLHAPQICLHGGHPPAPAAAQASLGAGEHPRWGRGSPRGPPREPPPARSLAGVCCARPGICCVERGGNDRGDENERGRFGSQKDSG
jgi:hypothetical protein